MMINQAIVINGRNSYTDFGITISDKKIGLPTKKVITETIPFYSGYYDFSSVQGFNFYDSRYLEYTFHITADTQLQLESLYQDVLLWLSDTQQSTIYDMESQKIFTGSLDKWDVVEDVLFKELTVSFKCQPYCSLGTQTISVNSIRTSYLPRMRYPTPLRFVNGEDNAIITLVVYTDNQQGHANRYAEAYEVGPNEIIEPVCRESGDLVLINYGGYVNIDSLDNEHTMPTMEVWYNERSL